MNEIEQGFFRHSDIGVFIIYQLTVFNTEKLVQIYVPVGKTAEFVFIFARALGRYTGYNGDMFRDQMVVSQCHL